MKEKLINVDMEILNQHSLVFFEKVIVYSWNQYSIVPDKEKCHFLLTDAWLRFLPDGEVNIEKTGHSNFISHYLAEEYHTRVGIPLYAINHTDIYDNKLEADLMKKPLIMIPEKIEVNGAVIPYGSDIQESLIAEAISKYAVKGASETEIINILTTSPPTGMGLYKRSPTNIIQIRTKLKDMVNQHILTYDSKKQKYTLTHREGTSQVSSE